MAKAGNVTLKVTKLYTLWEVDLVRSDYSRFSLAQSTLKIVAPNATTMFCAVEDWKRENAGYEIESITRKEVGIRLAEGETK